MDKRRINNVYVVPATTPVYLSRHGRAKLEDAGIRIGPSPLSKTALDALADAARAPVPTQKINPGVVHKLTTEGWAEIKTIPSPYPTHKPGTTITALVATQKGRDRIAYEERNHG